MKRLFTILFILSALDLVSQSQNCWDMQEIKSAIKEVDFLPPYFFALFDEPKKIEIGESLNLKDRTFKIADKNQFLSVEILSKSESSFDIFIIREQSIDCENNRNFYEEKYYIYYDDLNRVSKIIRDNKFQSPFTFNYIYNELIVSKGNVEWHFNKLDQIYIRRSSQTEKQKQFTVIRGKDSSTFRANYTPEAQSNYRLTLTEYDDNGRLILFVKGVTDNTGDEIKRSPWTSLYRFEY